jgi:outer membrane receptor protein involved in Fe transport
MSYRRLLLATTIVAGLSATAPTVFAQQTANDDQTKAEQADTEEVVVTGSRIRRERFDTVTPITTVGEEEFELTGVGNAVDVVNDVPLIGGGSTSRGANTQLGDNFSFVDIFDLGTQRTLTLVNGRRYVSQNQGTVFVPENATGAQVDLTVIPPGLIQRVEITPGTGGAVYGADAVSGVLNFILKDDFEGLDFTATAGITELGDGEEYRASVIWGRNFFDDRLNVTLAADYFDQAAVPTGGDREFTRVGAITNPFSGTRRRTEAFNAQAAADLLRSGAALPSVFLPGASDGVPSDLYGFPISSGSVAYGGLLVNGSAFPTAFSGTTPLIPLGLVPGAQAGRAADPQNFAFFAPSSLPTGVDPNNVINTLAPGTNLTGLSATQRTNLALGLLQRARPTPYEYFQQNPGLNPNLFVGSFFSTTGSSAAGPLGFLPTIPNNDPATSALFPRVAVPLQFGPDGNLVPFNLGNLTPPNVGTVGSTFGGDGLSNAARGYTNLRSSTERASFTALTNFRVTDNIRYKAEYMYVDLEFDSFAGVQTNAIGGSLAAGNRAIPIYIDQNPYLTPQAKAQIDQLAAQGATIPTLNGQRVLFSSTGLTNLYPNGHARSGNEVEVFRTAQILEGEFSAFDREFYWDAAYVYGSADIRNYSDDILDIEFALATDVVLGANNQPVCRQQTLAAPEPINIRNPGLNNINTTLSLTPTAAQVAACRPLNLLGEGRADPAAAAYVLTDGGSDNETRQHYAAASFGGELVRLPAGWLSAVAQIEKRRETLDFLPGSTFRTGAGRATTGQGTTGELEFLEYGYEIFLPVFGGDFTVPGFHSLEFEYAFRLVDRDQNSSNPLYALSPSPGTTDDAFTVGFRWAVTEDLAFRGNRSQSVRSPSLVELFSSVQSGFFNSTYNPCTTANISAGPAPDVRRENCIRAVVATGAAADRDAAVAFLSNFQGSGPGRPASVTGNPSLANEQAAAYSYGATFTPRWVPRLTLAADFYAVDIAGQVGLVGGATTINQCFDLPEFPQSRLGTNAACDLSLFGVLDQATGVYVNPAVNPLTGNPVPAFAPPPGTPAAANAPFQTSWFNFINFNLAAVKFRAANIDLRYNFPLEWLFGQLGSNWGDIYLSGTAYNLQRYDRSGNGTFTDVNKDAGEPGRPKWDYRFDVAHRMGGFDQRLTWQRTSDTVENVQVAADRQADQSSTFFRPGYDFFNYSIGYRWNDDRYSARLTVNNLTDTKGPLEEFGLVGDTIGRTFILQVGARF